MLFKQAILAKVARGEVAVAYRRWRKPSVKAGGYLITHIGRLAIDAVEPAEAALLTDADARAAGEPDLATLTTILAKGAGDLHRITFHLEGADPRIALRSESELTPAELAALGKRLMLMDGKSPWTAAVMALIRDNPGCRAGDLAPRLGMVTLDFKIRVRRLKGLGLTISLGTGYRISPRGEVLMGLQIE